MLLIEADGKALFKAHGIVVPAGVLVTKVPVGLPPGSGPWVVKAQVPVGSRGKAGGIRHCGTPRDVNSAVEQLMGTWLKGHRIDACLVEQVLEGEERYLAVMVDAAQYGLRVLYAARGGINIEQSAGAQTRLCAPTVEAVSDAFAALVEPEPLARRDGIIATGKALATLLIERELALVEINPLFVSRTGCVAGDAKVVVDLNAVHRQPEIAALIEARPAIYGDANRKLREGFDYVELDPQGEIGLITTGAGLSMMLIDELNACGARPLNFCDIRTGQMRGNPARLKRVLGWLTERTSLRVVLVNIFAGITDLAEFAALLASAVEETPSLSVPVVARLVGRGAEDAQRILAERQPSIVVTGELPEALTRTEAIVKASRP